MGPGQPAPGPRPDKVFEAFLRRQRDEGLALARESDLFELLPLDFADGLADRFIVRFRCKGLVRDAGGVVGETSLFEVGIWFPETYLRCPHPPDVVLCWFGPHHVFHPNIRPPFICVGEIAPATRLVDLLYQVFEMITYTKFNCASALNAEAAAWARDHLAGFPVDRRPLKRRRLALQAELREEAR
jgi:hypothetical protein